MFDWERGIALHAMLGIGPHPAARGKSHVFFSSCGMLLGYILDLQQGWPFETRVCSVKSAFLSS